MARPILLASGSAVRRQLLANAGVAVETRDHGIDERAVEKAIGADEAASRVALALAKAKALAVSLRETEAIVIGADQTLEIDGETLSKPGDMRSARRQIEKLSGRTHVLHSAFAVAEGGRLLVRGVKTARMTMRALEPKEIERYLREAGPTVASSVGAYQLEGPGIRLFERISGDYFTILGLPLLPLLANLRRIGAIDG